MMLAVCRGAGMLVAIMLVLTTARNILIIMATTCMRIQIVMCGGGVFIISCSISL